jgi:hypothetical protein
MRDTLLAGLIQTAQPQLLYRSGSRGLTTGRAGGYAPVSNLIEMSVCFVRCQIEILSSCSASHSDASVSPRGLAHVASSRSAHALALSSLAADVDAI